MGERVWIIGLDGATWSLMDRFIEKGRLPWLRQLRERGAWGVLRSTEPPLSPAAWTTFATGKLPGKHGVLDHAYRREGTYEFSFVNSSLRGATPIWSYLSQQGKTVVIINVPLTYPPDPVRGCMVTGMYTPSDDHPFTYPPELGAELRRELGEYKVIGERSKEDLDAALRSIFDDIKMRTEAASYLTRKYDPDLMVLVYGATDMVQHKFWKFADPHHPQHEPDTPSKFKTAIEDVYANLDEALGRLIREAPGDTTFLIMSDHGAGPLYKYIYLNNWLLREGFMRVRKGALASMRYCLYRLGITPLKVLSGIGRLNARLVDAVVGGVRKDMQRRKSKADLLFLSWQDIDWERTTAYAVGGNLGGAFVNLKGREPSGIISPGRQYEAVRDKLLERLGELKDPSTGEPVVEVAWRREEIYRGPYLERIPDVVFRTRGCRYMVFGIHEFASNAVMEPSAWFSGAHSPDGILIMVGRAFKEAERLTNAGIEDIAPTVLHLMGFGVPEDMDGRVLKEAFRTSFLEQNPPTAGDAWDKVMGSGKLLGPEEESAVKRQLEGLGYL